MIRRVLTLTFALALAGCGFHLRGALTVPDDLGPVRVKSVDQYSPLADSLSSALQHAGAQTADSTNPDAAVLDLLSERWGDTPISVDQFGRSQEYNLRYAVIFELRRADGSRLVPRQTIELTRDYISNPVSTIGTEGEREILVRELRREMTAAVLRRIDAVTKTDTGTVVPASRLDEPVAEDAAKAALEAADANPPPEAPLSEPQATEQTPSEPAPAEPQSTEPQPAEPPQSQPR